MHLKKKKRIIRVVPNPMASVLTKTGNSKTHVQEKNTM